MKAHLSAHPAYYSGVLDRIEVWLERVSATNLRIRYEAIGRLGDVVIPSPAPPLRTDNLWRATCFELFVRAKEDTAYREFNFSPSGRWAAYQFDAYRDGMTQALLPGEPLIATTLHAGHMVVDVRLSLDLPDKALVALAAVIEEANGTKSYWALTHPNPDKPDFHHPACFTLELPPPANA